MDVYILTTAVGKSKLRDDLEWWATETYACSSFQKAVEKINVLAMEKYGSNDFQISLARILPEAVVMMDGQEIAKIERKVVDK